MTVKELIEVLEACNQDAEVYYCDDSGCSILKDRDIFQDNNGKIVTIDISVAALAYNND